MKLRHRTAMTGSLSSKAARTARVSGTGRKDVPDYEKPLVKTGEARLWRTLNRGDRVEVTHGGHYSMTGTIDQRTPDGGTVWILLDRGAGRIAVTEGDQAALVPLE